MAGLLDSATEPPAEETTGQDTESSNMDIADPILTQIEDGIESAVPPELKKQYMSVVVAGMKVMFSKQTSQFLDQRMEQSGDIVEAVSNGIADLLMLIYNESKRTMSIPAAMLAAFTLMCQALDFAEKAGKVQVTPELASQCADATWQAAASRFGITKDKIDAVIAQSSGAQPQEDAQQSASEQPQPMMDA